MTPDDAARSPGEVGRVSSDDRERWDGGTHAKNDGVVAVLGPTNTGKTHYAIDRMLGHKNGVIGFPLRLLAREIYDRIVAMRGPRDVALITGEEKIVPVDARFYICTVESMPLDWGAEFVAVDEIQLCADPERGHVFTDRLLHARGRSETLFLGSATMRDRIQSLAPGTRFVTRERLSALSYAGSKKISRLPPRTAIVGFSVDSVYAIAELIRRQKGGAAVVMGALSPRTRNAQVELYQDGDVDYLVATDAIGMGLNLDVRHVAFSGLRKFDGRRHRLLEANELAQIAGRAGRHTNDGTFGVTGEASPLDETVVQAIENHRFSPVDRLQWRSARLDYATPFNLLLSLEREPPARDLQRARDADDVIALRHLARMTDIADMAKGRNRVRLLWDVCQIPDFRKTMTTEHAALLAEIYRFLASDAGVVPEDWIAGQCARLDRTEGDIDALSKRLSYIRTWTYVANRGRWLADPGHWRERTREIEDKLSDALHARLTQRFVDRRTSVLARRLKEKEALVATVDDAGAVTVEGEFVGKLEGFRFEPDPSAAGAEVKTLQAAGAQALQTELARRVEKFYNAPDGEIDVTEQGGMMWGDAAVGRLEPAPENASPLSARAIAFADDMVDAALKEKIERRLQFWIDRKLQAAFEPLFAMKDDETLTGMARGVAFQLVERYGVIPRHEINEDLKALAQDARGMLRKHGVRFGQHTVFIPALLKPAPTRLRMLLWGLSAELPEIPSPPPPGAVTIPATPLDLEQAQEWRYYSMAGYRLCGPRALRIDMLERLADMLRTQDARAGFEATPEMMSITGATLDQLAELLQGLGFVAEKGERPKRPKPKATQEAEPQTVQAAGAEKDGAATVATESDVGPDAQPDAETVDVAPLEDAAPDASVEQADGASKTREAAAEEAEPASAPDEAAAAETQAQAQEAAAETAEAASKTQDTMVEAAGADAAAQELSAEAASEPEEAAAEHLDAAAEEREPLDEAAAAQAGGEATETAPSDASDAAPTSDDGAAADGGPVEMETFYLFKIAPRRRRSRPNEQRDVGEGRSRKRGPRTEARGEPREGARPERGQQEGGDGRRPGGSRPQEAASERRGPPEGGQRRDQNGGERRRSQDGQGGRRDRQGGKGDGKFSGKGTKSGGAQKPREFKSSPKRGDRADPDSPFAILQQLKDRS